MAKVLVEYVRLDRAGERERESSVLLGLAGEPEILSEIGDAPRLTAGAPPWGKDGGLIVAFGYARVTVLAGAVLCSWGGTNPDPAKGVRIAAGGREIHVQLKAGEKLAFIEAAPQPDVGVARADLQTIGNQALVDLAAAAAGAGLRILPPANSPAGVAPVTGAFSASGESLPFAAVPGRPINLSLQADEAWSGTVRLLRKLPGDDTYRPLTMLGEPWAAFTGSAGEPAWEETEVGSTFVLACEHVAGVITYRISQ